MSPGWLTQLNMLWGGKGVRVCVLLLVVVLLALLLLTRAAPANCRHRLQTVINSRRRKSTKQKTPKNSKEHPRRRRQARRHQGPLRRRALPRALQVDGRERARVPAPHRARVVLPGDLGSCCSKARAALDRPAAALEGLWLVLFWWWVLLFLCGRACARLNTDVLNTQHTPP